MVNKNKGIDWCRRHLARAPLSKNKHTSNKMIVSALEMAGGNIIFQMGEYGAHKNGRQIILVRAKEAAYPFFLFLGWLYHRADPYVILEPSPARCWLPSIPIEINERWGCLISCTKHLALYRIGLLLLRLFPLTLILALTNRKRTQKVVQRKCFG